MIKKGLEDKWGEQALAMGWTALPTTLLFMQSRLGISTLGMNIILNLVMHWWEREGHPYPSQESMANRMGVSKRSIQREIAKLCKKGLIKKVSNSARDPRYRGRNIYDLTPLATILNEESESVREEIGIAKSKKEEVIRGSTDFF